MMKKLLMLSVILMFSHGAFASSEHVRVDRYSIIETKPTVAQADLLSVVINVAVPDHVVTVGETLQHILERSGFSMASVNASDPALPILLRKKLPRVHRHLGPITLREALSTLAGPAWQLVEDPVNRMVTFQLLNQYSNFRPSANK